MELTFTYKPELKLYIAEFRADKEFNIHIERPEPGYISMQQNSAEGGKYAAVDDWGTQNNDKLIIDYESGYFVTPKFIKIISKVLPTYAAITTDGEVTEIKSQAKVVEISSNGTTSVEPDAGFSYLSKVDVKVDVPTSGEGGGESGGGNAPSGDWHYFDISELDSMAKPSVIQNGMLYKLQGEETESLFGSGTILPAGIIYLLPDTKSEIRAIAIDFTTKVQLGEQITTIGESITTAPWYGIVPEITEAEFYNLES